MKDYTTYGYGTQKSYSLRDSLPGTIITIILVLLALTVVLPLILPFFFVFKTQLEYAYNPWGWPTHLRWTNFQEAWIAVQIGQGLLNTLIVCLGAVICTVPSAAMAGYIFSRYRSKLTEAVFYGVMAGWFVPVMMVLIPIYKLVSNIGLSDTLPGLFMIMTAFGIPFWTIIYRSFFRSLPSELAEAARIDGAGHMGTFFRVMLPLANPATVLAVLLVFIGAWSDYMLSLIILSNQDHFTMQLRVAQFLNQYGVDRMPRYAAAAIIAAAPTVLLYIIGHRWIIRGTLAGSIKG